MGIFVITGAQRSGTTALQTALSSTGCFKNFSEIFHTSNSISGATFLDFARMRALPLDSMISDEDGMALANAYLDFLVELTPPDQHILIDIKFNSWNVIRGWWCYIFSEPLFMRVLKTRKAEFILLRRRDLVDQILSNSIASKANKWHNMTENDRPEPFEVHLGSIKATAEMIIRAEDSISAFLKPYSNARFEWYEELFDNNVIKLSLRQHLSHKFGVQVDQFVPSPIKKNDVSKETIITNYGEARSVVEEIIRNLNSKRDAVS